MACHGPTNPLVKIMVWPWYRGLLDPNSKVGHDFVLQPDPTEPPQLCGS